MGEKTKKDVHTHTYSHTAWDWYTWWSTSHGAVDSCSCTHAASGMVLHVTDVPPHYWIRACLFTQAWMLFVSLCKCACVFVYYSNAQSDMGECNGLGEWEKINDIRQWLSAFFRIWVWQIILLRVSSVTYMVRGKESIYAHSQLRIKMTVELHACCKAEKAGLIIDRPACQVYFYMILHQNRECRSRDRIRVLLFLITTRRQQWLWFIGKQNRV